MTTTDKRKTLYFFRAAGLAMASMIGLGYWQRTILNRAVSAVVSHGGNAGTYGDEQQGLGVVNLSGTPVTDSDLEHLAPLFQAAQGPSSLDLSRTRITDAGLAHLRGLDRTTTLNLNGTTIDGSGLAHLALLGTQSLETGAADVTLKLAGTPLNDAALHYLLPITHLADVDLSGTRVTGPGLAQLHGMRYLHGLSLDGAPLTDEGLSGLDNWKGLAELSIANTQISDIGVARLRKLEGLVALNLKGTKITSACVGNTLASWPRLKSVSLANTGVSNEAILGLKAPGTLDSLVPSDTGLNDETLEKMAGWRGLRTLSLERTQVTEAGLQFLARLPDLDRLYLSAGQFTNEAVARLQRERPKLSIDH